MWCQGCSVHVMIPNILFLCVVVVIAVLNYTISLSLSVTILGVKGLFPVGEGHSVVNFLCFEL